MAKQLGPESNEDSHKFSNLNYTTLAGLIKQGPAALRATLDLSGAAGTLPFAIPTPADAGMGQSQQKIMRTINAKAEKKDVPRRGEIYLHTKRGTKVTIIQACVDTSDVSHDMVHLVTESKTGKKFRALGKYLTRL